MAFLHKRGVKKWRFCIRGGCKIGGILANRNVTFLDLLLIEMLCFKGFAANRNVMLA